MLLLYQKKLQKERVELAKKCKKFPEGSLACYKNGNSYKWFQEIWKNGEHKRFYIPRSKRKLAESLAEKSYYRQRLLDIDHELKLLHHYVNGHRKVKNVNQLLQKHAGFADLLSQMFQLENQKLREWQEEPYEKSTKYQEHLKIRCANGLVVRSKSEQIIATALLKHKIPFRYECVMQLEGIVVAPDFTICHPISGEIRYWEHFGMMDDENYLKDQSEKLELYQRNGIYLGENLIATFETHNHPLDEEYVEHVIQNYFEL